MGLKYMFDRLKFWKEKGMTPKVIYDIGAHCGDWSREARKVFPLAQIFAFEANGEHAAALSDLSANIVLLGAESQDIVAFYKNTIGCTTGNSIYCEQTVYFKPQIAEIELLPMKRLDEVVKNQNLAMPDFLKLDVQGAELDILKGAGSLLEGLKYCVLEASLHQYNRDAPMIEEIIGFMNEHDFYLIDIVEMHRINGYLAQVDLLFARSSTGLRKEDFYEGLLKFE
jgi:FkbM family methyltransferase